MYIQNSSWTTNYSNISQESRSLWLLLEPGHYPNSDWLQFTTIVINIYSIVYYLSLNINLENKNKYKQKYKYKYKYADIWISMYKCIYIYINFRECSCLLLRFFFIFYPNPRTVPTALLPGCLEILQAVDEGSGSRAQGAARNREIPRYCSCTMDLNMGVS
jgi:hypothetical protein